jgi:hypothetical protein
MSALDKPNCTLGFEPGQHRFHERSLMETGGPPCQAQPSYTAEPGEAQMKTISRADPKYALDARHEPVARVSLGESLPNDMLALNQIRVPGMQPI